MTRQKALKFAIEELTKAKRKFAPEAHIYQATGAPSLAKFARKYAEFEAAIAFLEKLLREGSSDSIKSPQD